MTQAWRDDANRSLVTQTILAGDPDGRLGNCLQAAVASLLELNLDDVPHLAEADDWIEAVAGFARLRGFDTVWRGGGAPAPVRGLAFGPTVRSAELLHAVAIVDGRIWDPHPSRVGLTSVSTYVDWVPCGEVSRG